MKLNLGQTTEAGISVTTSTVSASGVANSDHENNRFQNKLIEQKMNT